MNKYTYKVQKASIHNTDQASEILSQLGMRGWRLINFHVHNHALIAIFELVEEATPLEETIQKMRKDQANKEEDQ